MPAVQGGGRLGKATTGSSHLPSDHPPAPGTSQSTTEPEALMPSTVFFLLFQTVLPPCSLFPSNFVMYRPLAFLSHLQAILLGVPPWTFWDGLFLLCHLLRVLSTVWVWATAYSCAGCALTRGAYQGARVEAELQVISTQQSMLPQEQEAPFCLLPAGRHKRAPFSNLHKGTCQVC